MSCSTNVHSYFFLWKTGNTPEFQHFLLLFQALKCYLPPQAWKVTWYFSLTENKHLFLINLPILWCINHSYAQNSNNSPKFMSTSVKPENLIYWTWRIKYKQTAPPVLVQQTWRRPKPAGETWQRFHLQCRATVPPKPTVLIPHVIIYEGKS